MDEAELDDVFAEADNEVQTTVDNIEDLLLSRQPENLDNYTLAVIFVNKVYQNPEKRKRIKKIVMITVIVVIAAIVIGVVLWFLQRHHPVPPRPHSPRFPLYTEQSCRFPPALSSLKPRA